MNAIKTTERGSGNLGLDSLELTPERFAHLAPLAVANLRQWAEPIGEEDLKDANAYEGTLLFAKALEHFVSAADALKIGAQDSANQHIILGSMAFEASKTSIADADLTQLQEWIGEDTEPQDGMEYARRYLLLGRRYAAIQSLLDLTIPRIIRSTPQERPVS